MSEAAPAPSAPTSGPSEGQSAPAQPSAPSNDNGAARGSAPVQPQATNDNAAPSAAEQSQLGEAHDSGQLTAAEFKALAEGGQIKLKVYGKERSVDASEALRLLQINAAGDDAFRAAAEQRKQFEQERQQIKAQVAELQRGLRESPLQMLRRLGLEDALYADLEQELQYQQLPEHERARFDLNQERQRLEQERQAWQQQQEQIQRQAAERQLHAEAQRYQQTFVQQYNQALDGIGMPQSERVRGRAIQLMARMHEQALAGGVEVPIEALAHRAQEELSEYARAFVGSAPPEKARELLGESWVRGVQQADVQRVQQQRAPNGQFVPKQAPQQSAPAPSDGDRPRQRFGSFREFQRALDKK